MLEDFSHLENIATLKLPLESVVLGVQGAEGGGRFGRIYFLRGGGVASIGDRGAVLLRGAGAVTIRAGGGCHITQLNFNYGVSEICCYAGQEGLHCFSSHL